MRRRSGDQPATSRKARLVHWPMANGAGRRPMTVESGCPTPANRTGVPMLAVRVVQDSTGLHGTIPA